MLTKLECYFKKISFSDIEIREICKQINKEIYEQDPSTWIKKLNTEKVASLHRIETQNTKNPNTAKKKKC